jgi:hypothetical protein
MKRLIHFGHGKSLLAKFTFSGIIHFPVFKVNSPLRSAHPPVSSYRFAPAKVEGKSQSEGNGFHAP